MQQSKIVQHLEALPTKERERFRTFVYSPYFNQHEKTIHLLDILLNYIEGNNKMALTREGVFDRLFPNESYDEQQLHNIMSYLKKLYHKFLAIRHFEEEGLQEQLYTVEQAYTFNQYDLMKNRSRQLEKKLKKYPYRNSEYFHINYRLNNLLGFYSGNHVDRSVSTTFQNMLYNLDKFFIVEKLRNCCHLTANTILMNTRYDYGFLDELLNYIEENWSFFEEERGVVLYYNILMSLRDEETPAYYEKLKELLNTQLKYFSRLEVNDLYSFSYNYCIRQINLGNREYQRELFELYQEGVKKELLINNGVLSEWDYKNVVTLGCKLREFNWTEKFIYEYKEKLPASKRENAYKYNLANLFYNKNQYDEALETLLHVEFTDVKYHLNTTFLLLRTYYALEDTEALLSLIETFRVYVIRNKKMTTDQKKGYTNFLRFAKKLVLLKHQSATYTRKSLAEKVENLAQKIEQTSNVINKYWLLEECQVAEPARG